MVASVHLHVYVDAVPTTATTTYTFFTVYVYYHATEVDLVKVVWVRGSPGSNLQIFATLYFHLQVTFSIGDGPTRGGGRYFRGYLATTFSMGSGTVSPGEWATATTGSTN